MSDKLINIRVFGWHFGVTRNWLPFLSYNSYHEEAGWPDGLFSIHKPTRTVMTFGRTVGKTTALRREFVFGVPRLIPISNVPADSTCRVRLRSGSFAEAFVRTSDGITKHYIEVVDGAWILSEPRDRNFRK